MSALTREERPWLGSREVAGRRGHSEALKDGEKLMAERGKERPGGKRHKMAQCHSAQGNGEGPGLTWGRETVEEGEQSWRKHWALLHG